MMPLWIRPIGSFLLMYWKPLALSLVGVFLYFKVTNAIDDWKEKEEVFNSKITQLVSERDRAIIKAESAEAALEQEKQHAERMELLFRDTLAAQTENREEAKKQKEVFEDHDFPGLAKAKPGLIEKLSNKATQERLDALEHVFNRD